MYRWLLGLTRVLERATRWILAQVNASDSVADVVSRNEAKLAQLRAAFPELVRGADKELYGSRVQEMMRHGATEEFANDIITLRFLDQLLEVLVIGNETNAEPVDAAKAYYRCSDIIHVPWLRSQIFRIRRRRTLGKTGGSGTFGRPRTGTSPAHGQAHRGVRQRWLRGCHPHAENPTQTVVEAPEGRDRRDQSGERGKPECLLGCRSRSDGTRKRSRIGKRKRWHRGSTCPAGQRSRFTGIRRRLAASPFDLSDVFVDVRDNAHRVGPTVRRGKVRCEAEQC